MIFKINDKTIEDTKTWGVFGKPTMIVKLDNNNHKSLVLGQGERTRAFILYLIDGVQKEMSTTPKMEDCKCYTILDNYLTMLSIQMDLLSGSLSSQWTQTICDFVLDNAERQISEGDSNLEDLRHAATLETALKLNQIHNKK